MTTKNQPLITSNLLLLNKPKSLRTQYWVPNAVQVTRSLSEDYGTTTPRTLTSWNSNFTWFKNYWILHQSKGVSQYSINREFKLMFFICTDGSGIYDVIALTKFYVRWENGLNLLFNLAFFNADMLSFSNKLFIEESLTFNWNFSLVNYKLFKYTQATIYFADSPYGEETKFGYERSYISKVDAALVTDVKTHQKNIFFLRTCNVYTVGLVPANYSPWILSFGIPLMGDSLLGQHYFLSVALRLTASAKSQQFDTLITKWYWLKRIMLPISVVPTTWSASALTRIAL